LLLLVIGLLEAGNETVLGLSLLFEFLLDELPVFEVLSLLELVSAC
jgi:hypothetical protein